MITLPLFPLSLTMTYSNFRGLFFRFMELGALLEPGRPPKTDKAAILVDAVRMVTQLRGEAQKLKDSNSNLQDKIKELKVIFIATCVTLDMYFTFIICGT